MAPTFATLEITDPVLVERADADAVVLGASALFNPHILLRSGITHRLMGRRLHEQLSILVLVDLGGVKAYDGSTVISGNGYVFYDGPPRRDYAACMIETWTSPLLNQWGAMTGALRSEPGRWRERQIFGFLFDDIPRDDNTVIVNAANPRLAETTFHDCSDYARRAAARVPQMVDKLSEAIPIERVVQVSDDLAPGHIQGTVVMGEDSSESIVDRYLIHHQLRNLLVLGASSFPTATPILPTWTVSALSLWAADHFLNKGA